MSRYRDPQLQVTKKFVNDATKITRVNIGVVPNVDNKCPPGALIRIPSEATRGWALIRFVFLCLCRFTVFIDFIFKSGKWAFIRIWAIIKVNTRKFSILV